MVLSRLVPGFVALTGALVFAVSGGLASRSAFSLSDHAVGPARFGEPEREAVQKLTAVLGNASPRFVNQACSPRYTEVAWHDLVVEFRNGRLSGFRYLVGGWPPSNRPANHSLRAAVTPAIQTSAGTALGDPLASVRQREGTLARIGADTWRSGAGLVFVDNATHDPVPATARIIEIKFGTCGDF